MKTIILLVVFVFFVVTTSLKDAYAEDPSVNFESVPWDILKDVKKVEGFQGKAWFCQAKTFMATTECYKGTKPPKPGCYILLNPERTAWIATSDAAGQLGADFLSPENKKNISSKSGFGCGTPDSSAYWLLWQIK